MGSRSLVLSSHNTHKLDEFRRLLGSEFEIQSLKDIDFVFELPEESTESYRENSTVKAEFVGRKTQKAVIADDSGLEVYALNGEPGILSARYGGLSDSKQQCEYLLKKLEGISDRRASFVCVLAFYNPETFLTLCFSGKVEGRIAEAPRGIEGFGYDPIFIPEKFEKTFGEMNDAEKDKISHRARACHLLKDYLQGIHFDKI